jgi:hypothetical protein
MVLLPRDEMLIAVVALSIGTKSELLLVLFIRCHLGVVVRIRLVVVLGRHHPIGRSVVSNLLAVFRSPSALISVCFRSRSLPWPKAVRN